VHVAGDRLRERVEARRRRLPRRSRSLGSPSQAVKTWFTTEGLRAAPLDMSPASRVTSRRVKPVAAAMLLTVGLPRAPLARCAALT
jgi:hypothetical protein